MLPNEMKESFLNCGRPDNAKIRTFTGGATRDTDKDKLDFEGFLSPVVLQHYAAYLHKHRVQSDGNYRDSDNWQKGIPLDTYMKSLCRHNMEVWLKHRNNPGHVSMEDDLCGVIFNSMGYLFEILRAK